MKRGSVVIVAPPGAYGKPRPAIIVQNDSIPHGNSILICLLTSDFVEAPVYRMRVRANQRNGLLKDSDVMVEKIFAISPGKIGNVIGMLDPADLLQLDAHLSVVLGLES
jgi:mRNA interferase MazF